MRKNLNLTKKILQTIFDISKEFIRIGFSSNEMIYYKFLKYDYIIKKMKWDKSRGQFTKAIHNLKRYGYLKIGIAKDERAIMLTPKGLEKALKISFEQKDKKRRRDGKWEMVIWDIPEDLQKTRGRFRNALRLLGYQRLQKSVWVCPYDILEETEELIRFYNIRDYVRIFLISEVEWDIRK